MWYSLVCVDAPNSLSLRRNSRPAHLARVQALQDAGRLLVAGPNPAIDSQDPGEAGFSGSLIIAEFNSLADAEAWAAADPYVQAGVWVSVAVKPFVKIMP